MRRVPRRCQEENWGCSALPGRVPPSPPAGSCQQGTFKTFTSGHCLGPSTLGAAGASHVQGPATTLLGQGGTGGPCRLCSELCSLIPKLLGPWGAPNSARRGCTNLCLPWFCSLLHSRVCLPMARGAEQTARGDRRAAGREGPRSPCPRGHLPVFPGSAIKTWIQFEPGGCRVGRAGAARARQPAGMARGAPPWVPVPLFRGDADGTEFIQATLGGDAREHLWEHPQAPPARGQSRQAAPRHVSVECLAWFDLISPGPPGSVWR